MARRRRGASPVQTLDLGSLERFQGELIAAGYEPTDAERRRWRGPVFAPLRPYTEADEMMLRFEDGWPFRHPRIFVPGLQLQHVNSRGEVCLWQEGDPSRQWLTLSGFEARVAAWAEAARKGFPDDPVLDSHLYFSGNRAGFATVDLSGLSPNGQPGHKGSLAGEWTAGGQTLTLTKAGRGGSVKGTWYFGEVSGRPPQDLDGIREVLTRGQAREFDKRLKNLRNGEQRVVLLMWNDGASRNALAVCIERAATGVTAEAIEVAPTDVAYLVARAGPDFTLLQEKRVVIFGAGAVGSHLALRLADCGLGDLVVIDNEPLRPANVVRHAAPRSAVGWNKAEATVLLTRERVPWTVTAVVDEAALDPVRIRESISGADLAVDATGSSGFANMLSVICEEEGARLLSAALFRRGAVARIRRQALQTDTPLYDRGDGNRYPIIPPGDEPVALEPGCSAPVNNASPAVVSAAAALTAIVAIDALAERYDYPDEVIEVYRALEAPPFDVLGRMR